MKDILFLAHRIPYPPNKGDKIRSFHFLKYLTSIYNVHLATFVDDADDWQYTRKLDELCASTCYVPLIPTRAKIASVKGLFTGEALSLPYYKNSILQEWVDDAITAHTIEKVLVFSSVMGQFINLKHNVTMVVDFVDVDSDKWQQYAQKKHGVAKWIYQREAQYLFKYEQRLAARAKIGVFVSEQEAALFKKLAPKVSDKISYINNGVDISYFSPAHIFESPYKNEANVPILVFTGAMDYWANVDAVKWFATFVFPHIVQNNPTAKFYIVGSKPTKDVLALANNNVVVTGAVPDVRPYLAHAHFAIAPLRIARGIQNKVLEAMSMSKYIVATSLAMEGIPHNSTLSVSVSDDADEMIKQLNALLAENSKTATNNRDFVKAKFSWESSLAKLEPLIEC